MAADERSRVRTKAIGRPRIPTAKPLVRRTVLVNPADLASLRALYGVHSDSEAVRRAVDVVLLVHALEDIADRVGASGGPEDVYRRTVGERPLPALFDPAKVTDEDRIRLPDVAKPHR